ncbi:hypothetical protein EVJ50_11975 [Synechococcus sp. RSCCF101]|uniref:hypothetical protein n=1 Tax=Synechococcus sp. RSCCF101 TaxID=2511069 RepID=UPI001248815E|nr:hypothetical protein [Synechococcus sp. RSCCF101]QEY32845.1 hypothetical protein EVJ50_11975 [Synechococcus sp. RSCCF101]
MAAPFATEQPSLNRAWRAFVDHIPTILLIWLATAVISGLGVMVYLAIALIGLAISGGNVDTDVSEIVVTLSGVLAQMGQLPFTLLSNLVGVLFVAVPALYYEQGETITTAEAFSALLRRPLRYLLAGVLFSLSVALGLLLCILPGLAVSLVMPVYVNRIFTTDVGIVDALRTSIQSVYSSEKGLTFVGIQLLVGLLVIVFTLCSCGVGALIAVPVATFYIQNAAYHQGVLR